MNAQNYKHIKKATQLINSDKNLAKALWHLEKAEKVDYGFCGNAWMEAFWRIHFERARIYARKGNYHSTLSELDSIVTCAFGGDCVKSDSLKLEALFLMYGVENVTKALESNFHKLVTLESMDENNRFLVHLESINYDLWLYIPLQYKWGFEHIEVREIFANEHPQIVQSN